MTWRRKDYVIRLRVLPVITVGIGVLVAGCSDNTPEVTGPRSPSALPASQLATSAVQSSDPLSSRLSSTPGACLVAVRSPDGKYRSKPVAVALSKQIAASSAATIEFLYRGWTPGVPQPTLLALCNIPDSRSARTYFEKQFGGKTMDPGQLRSFAQLAGVSGVEYWAVTGGPQVLQGAATTYVTDGVASESPATKSAQTGEVSAMLVPVTCDPTDLICDGYTPEEEYVPPQPPPPSPGDGYESSMTAIYDPTKTPNPFPPPQYPTVGCWIKTDRPHLSTHMQPLEVVNVIGWTGKCNVPASITAQTVLGRMICTVGTRYCQWLQIANEDYKTHFGTYVEAKSNVACTLPMNHYKGVSRHTLTAYGFRQVEHTASEWISIKCPNA